jgi:hypothetical protein
MASGISPAISLPTARKHLGSFKNLLNEFAINKNVIYPSVTDISKVQRVDTQPKAYTRKQMLKM